MKNIKVIEGFETTDGRKFTEIGEAKLHQTRLDVIAYIKKTDFKLSFKTEVSDMIIGDLSILSELGKIVDDGLA